MLFDTNITEYIPIDQTVCIVGNAGSLLNRNDGDIIDSFDHVIRFNNFSTATKYLKSTGIKTTVWCTTFCKDIKPREFDKIVCPLALHNQSLLKRYDSTDLEQLQDHSSTAKFVPESIFFDLLSLNANPSTGLSLLFWMKTVGYKITKECVFGFDNFTDDTNHHYFDNDRDCAHKPEIEKRIFNLIVEDVI